MFGCRRLGVMAHISSFDRGGCPWGGHGSHWFWFVTPEACGFDTLTRLFNVPCSLDLSSAVSSCYPELHKAALTSRKVLDGLRPVFPGSSQRCMQLLPGTSQNSLDFLERNIHFRACCQIGGEFPDEK